MKKKITAGFWEFLAGIILRNRIIISVGIVLSTVFLALQSENVGMTYNEANLLPKNHKANKDYTQFLNVFGEEGNLIVIGIKDNSFFTPSAYKAWHELMTNLKSHKEVELVVSLNDLKKLQKNDTLEKFELVPLLDQKKTVDPLYLKEIQRQLFNDLPFYEGLLFNKKSGSIRAALYINKKVVNSPSEKNLSLIH